MSQGGNKIFRINSRYDRGMFNHSLVLEIHKWAEKLPVDTLGPVADILEQGPDKLEQGLGKLEPVLRMSDQENQQGQRGQRGLDIQGSQVFLEGQRVRRVQEVQLVLGHLDNQELRVCLVVQRGQEVLQVQLVLDHQGIQERPVCLVVQRGLGHQGNQEFQQDRGDHLCLVYLVGLVHLKNNFNYNYL